MVQDGLFFFACDSVAEITKTFLVVQLYFPLTDSHYDVCLFLGRAFEECQDKFVKQKHMRYRLHHLQLEGVRAKIQ